MDKFLTQTTNEILGRLAVEQGKVIELKKDKPAFKLEYVTLENIFTTKLVEKPIVEGLLYEEEPTILYGEGGVGKSLGTEDLSMALGAGCNRLWGIFEIPQYCASLFIQSENGRLSVYQRTALKCEGNKDYICGLPNIIYASQHGNIQVAGHVANQNFRRAFIEFAKRVEDENQIKFKVCFWDPLISFHDAEENDNSRMRTTLDLISLISNEIGATPIVVHHANKEKGIRGASSIRDWARNIIKLEDVSYKGEKRIRFIHEKCNNHKMFDPFVLAMDEYLNFYPIEFSETISKGQKDRCQKVKEALELLVGSADTKGRLANQYMELTGIKSRSTAFRHIDKAVQNEFFDTEFYEEGNLKQSRYWIGVNPFGF